MVFDFFRCFRGNEFSEDVDVLLTHPDFVSPASIRQQKRTKTAKLSVRKAPEKILSSDLLERVVKELTRLKFITDTFTFGKTKFMVI